MAQSPSHKFGQIIGDLLESMLYVPLAQIAETHGLYLDYQHPRTARGGKRKVAWTDHKGNVHDLDYVLESSGSESERGTPKAFIETAWRRYTKHSRNKAQEIQGAIIPLAETYGAHYPFLGVVLAGVFTSGSLQQLRSHGFSVLYYPYDAICEAFSTVGIDAPFDEHTSDAELQEKVDAFHALSKIKKQKILTTLLNSRRENFQQFLDELETSLNRQISRISIIALHGSSTAVLLVDDAVKFIEDYDEDLLASGFVRYEINVEYSNGDKINANFNDKRTSIQFLTQLH